MREMAELVAAMRQLVDRIELAQQKLVDSQKVAPVPRFVVGDLVVCISDGHWNRPSLIGKIGVVRSLMSSCITDPDYGNYGVEFAEWRDGHGLSGTLGSGSAAGYYLSAACLRKCNPK